MALASTIRLQPDVDEWWQRFGQMPDEQYVMDAPGLCGTFKAKHLRKGLEMGAIKLTYPGLTYTTQNHVRNDERGRCACAWCRWERYLSDEDKASGWVRPERVREIQDQAGKVIKLHQVQLPF